MILALFLAFQDEDMVLIFFNTNQKIAYNENKVKQGLSPLLNWIIIRFQIKVKQSVNQQFC